MSTSPVTYPPGSAAKTKKIFDQAKTNDEDELDSMEKNLSDYHRDRATAARLESLENFMQAQQTVQVSMQKRSSKQTFWHSRPSSCSRCCSRWGRQSISRYRIS